MTSTARKHAGPGPSSVTAAPTGTGLVVVPCGSMRKTQAVGDAPCGHEAPAVSPCSSTSGPAAVSATVSVTEPLNVPASASEVSA